MRSELPFLLLAGFASTVAAQQTALPDPTVATANVPRPVYESAFATYRPWIEPATGRWREANEEVRRLGGHAGHVKPEAKVPPASGKRGAK